MRIAHVAPPAGQTASGILTVLADLTAALARRGHAVELWHAGDWSAPGLRLMIRTLDDAGVRCVQFQTSRPRGRILPKVTLPAGTLVDLVHLHSVFVPLHAAVSLAWTGPLVLSPHGGYDPVSLRRGVLRKQVYSALHERRMVRRATTVAALTDVEAEQVRDYAGPVATAVVPNGVAPQSAAGRGAELRDRLGIPGDARLAVFVGRLDVHHKGLDRLIAAAAVAPSWHVLLVGPDYRDGRGQLHRMAADLGASDRVHFSGQVEPAELSDVHSAADLFVLPSRWEGLPMSLLEALAHAVPALVTPEVDRLVPVSSREAGWVCVPDDLGLTLETLATVPPATWSKRAAAARELALGYDWDSVAAAYEEVYGATLRRWAGGSAVSGAVAQ